MLSADRFVRPVVSADVTARRSRGPGQAAGPIPGCSGSGCPWRCCVRGIRRRRVGRRTAGPQRAGGAAGRDRPAVRPAVRVAQGPHTALLSLRHLVEVNPIAATPRIIADIDPLLADTHAFEELRMLSQLPSRPTTLNEEMASLRRIIGGSGTDAASRLGLTPEAPYDGPRAAFAAASGGGAAPNIPSTTHSPRARAGRRCVVPRRWSPSSRRAAGSGFRSLPVAWHAAAASGASTSGGSA